MHVEPPADVPDDGDDDGGNNLVLFIGIGAGVVVLLGIVVFFLVRRKA